MRFDPVRFDGLLVSCRVYISGFQFELCVSVQVTNNGMGGCLSADGSKIAIYSTDIVGNRCARVVLPLGNAL